MNRKFSVHNLLDEYCKSASTRDDSMRFKARIPTVDWLIMKISSFVVTQQLIAMIFASRVDASSIYVAIL